ncbi:hypothetical protein [Sphingomonas soli]|uniref:hypothetical protein n=1 Tax=Sphingomonas soli TaxID=266127 RepID=UPI0012EE2E47|nr:hypothetical protein [Sphingomonas soli]
MGIVVLLMALAKCVPSQQTSQHFGSPSLENQIAAIEPPPTVDPLNPRSVELGVQHLRAVLGAEGISGAMIYSQNCYDALARDFSWKMLDRCGAFDMLAVKAVEGGDMSGLDSEAQYFDPEAAAGRYLAAATKAGEEAGKADVRLEALKQKTGRITLPSPRKAATAESGDAEEAGPGDEQVLDENAQVEV